MPIRANGTTVVLVEQSVQRSLQLADQAVVLERGTVRQRGTGAELRRDPAAKAAYLSF